MEKVYELKLEEEESFKESNYLCISVMGFIELWEEFAGTSYRGCSLEGFLLDKAEWSHSKNFLIADCIRNEIRAMLPCSMTAGEFEDIVDNHIDRYFGEDK